MAALQGFAVSRRGRHLLAVEQHVTTPLLRNTQPLVTFLEVGAAISMQYKCEELLGYASTVRTLRAVLAAGVNAVVAASVSVTAGANRDVNVSCDHGWRYYRVLSGICDSSDIIATVQTDVC
jgi:hypothetical protein